MLRRLAASLLLTALACGAPPPATPAPVKPAPPPTRPADPPTPPVEPDTCADFPAAAQLAAVTAATDLPAVAAAYTNTPLQDAIKASDAATGRKDDATITAALADTTPAARVIATTAIQNALSQSMRASLKTAAEDPDPIKRPPAWQAARCAWQHGVRPLAAELQSRSAELSSETSREDSAIADDIDALFATDPTDERKLLPARQAIEKTWYRVLHRLIESEARKAHDASDPVAARRALGLFAMLRDRLQDRNTPGITIVEAQLTTDLARLDPAAVLKQIDLALIKRARKYCSEAVDPKLQNTAAGAASVTEGMTYTRIFLPAMRATLAAQKFDAAGHMATWQAYADAVDSGDDRDEIKKLSDELVHWNCAYQQVLGIRECTSTVDELPPK